jgi:hypothetical protein
VNGGWFLKTVLASVPILVGALTAVAWNNSHNLALLTREYDDIRGELAHQRDLMEQRLAGCK